MSQGLEGVQLHLVQNLEDANKFMTWLGERRPVLALDTETTGLDPYASGSAIRLLQIGDAMTGWAIPFKEWYGLIHEGLRKYDSGPIVMHNCLAGETRFVTKTGVARLMDLAGSSTDVWTQSGWASAEIKHFGRQSLRRVVLAPKGRRTNVTREVLATPTHRWELEDGSLTTEISVGDVIPWTLPEPSIDEHSDGFRHGLIYGDGTLHKRGSKPGRYRHQIRLCGKKSGFASSFSNVTHPATYDGDPQAYLVSPRNLKELPTQDDTVEYVANFIAGWLAADATYNSTLTTRQLSTTKKEDIAWLEEFSVIGGYIVVGLTDEPIRSAWAAKETDTTWKVTLARPSEQSRRFSGWRIKRIENLPGEHDVFCAVVPGVERFTLDHGIYTANSAFEMRWLARHADYLVPRHQFHDTMLMAHIVNPLGSGALKTLAVQHVDPRSAAGQQRLEEAFAEKKWDWASVPLDFPPYWSYSALDTVLTARLFEHFQKQCGPSGQFREAYELEIATRYIISRMERMGARIDVDYAQTTYNTLRNFADSVSEWGKKTYGISVGSPQQLGRKLIELGAEITRRTKTGLPQVDKYTLELMTFSENQDIVSLARKTLDMRKAAKYAETYFSHFIHDTDSNNHIHADIRTLGAKTSRMSIGSPAFQQLPKGESLVRKAIIPREGHVLLTSDYNQIEMRLLAHFSQDKDLIKAFQTADSTGGDFFVEVGKELYNDPTFKKSDPRRGPVKNTLYALSYQAGLAKLAETAGVPEAQIAPVYNGIIQRYPGIKRFSNEIIRLGDQREQNEGFGYVELSDKRRLACDPGFSYKLVNYVVQGTAAVIFKRGLVRLDMAGYGDVMVLPVHDEIVLDIEEGDFEYAKDEVPALLADLDYDVPLSADAEGPFPNWGWKAAQEEKKRNG